ncbi:hypothetical protein JZ751_023488 [Albula glossodonta]|uniref:Cytochrome b-c1 complex subunit 9 n=1 Tax=Albula glossodonta TaxID=121402 RepID=A0A8T2NTC6_9TELE|nr:hypothetical protein JZ751_023488 [Albula glossodonta]
MVAEGSGPRLLFNRAFALTITAMVAVFFGRTLFGHGNPIFDELNRGSFRRAAHPLYGSKMGIDGAVYKLLFRRTSAFTISIMVGAVFFERMFDQTGNAIFEELNRGAEGRAKVRRMQARVLAELAEVELECEFAAHGSEGEEGRQHL